MKSAIKYISVIFMIMTLCCLLACENREISQIQNEDIEKSVESITNSEDESAKENDSNRYSNSYNEANDNSDGKNNLIGDIDSEVVEEADENQSSPGMTAKVDVSNNGHYFVKIQDRVYFREYGTKALENPTIWGHYLLTPTGESSYIDYYDEKTGETVRAFEDFGFGNIAFLEPVLFMNGLDFSASEYGTPYIYAMDRFGEEIDLPEIIHGTIKGVSDDNEMLFYENTYAGNEYHHVIGALTNDGNKDFIIESDNLLTYIGTHDNYLIYAEIIYETGKTPAAKIWSRDLCYGKSVLIDDLTCSEGASFEFGELFTTEETYYLPVIEIAGSGNMFQNGFVLSYRPNVEQSGRIAADFYADEDDDTPRVRINGVERSFNDLSNDTYYIKRKSYKEDGDLYKKQKNGREYPEAMNIISGADYYDVRKDLTLAEPVDENAFIMLATEVYDAEGSIGWRDGFRLLKMEYLKTNGDGSYDILTSVDYE